VTGNSAGANHLAELDAHLESHVAELRRRAQHARDELVAEADRLGDHAAPAAPTYAPSDDDAEFDDDFLSPR
jgi:hypothetical protein